MVSRHAKKRAEKRSRQAGRDVRRLPPPLMHARLPLLVRLYLRYIVLITS